MPEKRKSTATSPKVKEMGRYIVADPKICHGKPTFRGTRIMVQHVREMVARGMPWEQIVCEWGGDVPREAIAEAVELARVAFLKRTGTYDAALERERKAS